MLHAAFYNHRFVIIINKLHLPGLQARFSCTARSLSNIIRFNLLDRDGIEIRGIRKMNETEGEFSSTNGGACARMKGGCVFSRDSLRFFIHRLLVFNFTYIARRGEISTNNVRRYLDDN